MVQQRKVDVLYADPPWLYKDDGISATHSKSGASAHYDLLSLEGLKQIPVQSIMAENSVCFMWATSPLLPEAFELMAAWGFEFKTVAFTWTKMRTAARPLRECRGMLRQVLRNHGLPAGRQMINEMSEGLEPYVQRLMAMGQGHTTRQGNEFVLYGTRGKRLKPAVRNVRSQLLEPTRRHSAKPLEAIRRIEQLYPDPDLTKLEMFCRTPQPGWLCWGDEVESTFTMPLPSETE